MELALAACLGWVITTCVLVNALREKDRHHAIQTSSLLNRIQAPEVTVAQELAGSDDFEPIVLQHTEESYWPEVERISVEDAA